LSNAHRGSPADSPLPAHRNPLTSKPSMSAHSPVPSEPAQAPTLLNLEQLESLVVLGRGDYLDLLNDVIQSVPVQLERIRAAIADGRAKRVSATAHELRGMLLYFGCDAMTRRLDPLENQPAIPPGEAATIHADLLSIWQQSLAAIKRWEQSVPDFTL